MNENVRVTVNNEHGVVVIYNCFVKDSIINCSLKWYVIFFININNAFHFNYRYLPKSQGGAPLPQEVCSLILSIYQHLIFLQLNTVITKFLSGHVCNLLSEVSQQGVGINEIGIPQTPRCSFTKVGRERERDKHGVMFIVSGINQGKYITVKSSKPKMGS